jgi:hypothetical protein
MRYLWSVLPVALALGGCADLNKSLTEANNSLITGRTIASAPASTTETRIEVPNDPKVSQAFDAALPTIQAVVGIQKCIKQADGMLLLNKYAVPGVAMVRSWWTQPITVMTYHNKNNCVSVRAIDMVSMPALNALTIRVVYYAEDSGETVNYKMLFKKMDNDKWLLAETPRQA